MIRKLLILLGLTVSTAAQAEWREATSRNFVVYSEASEEALRAFTAQLERFHFILRVMNNVTREPPPNRLHVFLMDNVDGVQHTFPYPAGGLAGYSLFDAREPVMVGTRNGGGIYQYGIDPERILLHEYTHHFMYGYFPATYPTWYQEGAAEFWGSTRILPNNVVRVGLPAQGRLQSFLDNRWIPIDHILAARSYADQRMDVDLIYSEGWLLVRYLFTNHERSGQLARYLNLINHGSSYEDATRQAFGADTSALDHELQDFWRQTQFPVLDVPFRPIDVGPITVRTLRPAEQQLVMQDIRLDQGVRARDLPDLLHHVRDVAGHYPDDPYALSMLVEAEHLAGNAAQAMAAVDRLLRIEPNNARALMYKGLLQAEALRAAHSTDAASWNVARQFIVQANHLAPNDPIVLQGYYDSYVDQGTLPPAPAQNALFHALELAPGDEELRYRVASDFEQRHMIPEAIAVIRPTALAMREIGNESERQRHERERQEEEYRAVGQVHHETAREMLTRLEQQTHGTAAAETAASH